MIETNQFFLLKDGVNQIVMRHKIGTQSDRKSQKQRGDHREISLPWPSMGVPSLGVTQYINRIVGFKTPISFCETY